jgi:enoyl-CoA hydratase
VKTLSHASKYIVEEFGEGIFTLRFCRPAERNTLSFETLTTLDQILDRISKISSVRAVILTGTDDVFLSGANIRELTKLDRDSAVEFSRRGQELTQRLADLKPVTIAAINGYCMGGGLDFALACDIRVASTNALFAHPGAKLGIITGWGGTQRLPRIVGRTKAIELFATARRLNSEEALEAGLVTELGDPVLDVAIRIAKSTLF